MYTNIIASLCSCSQLLVFPYYLNIKLIYAYCTIYLLLFIPISDILRTLCICNTITEFYGDVDGSKSISIMI